MPMIGARRFGLVKSGVLTAMAALVVALPLQAAEEDPW